MIDEFLDLLFLFVPRLISKCALPRLPFKFLPRDVFYRGLQRRRCDLRACDMSWTFVLAFYHGAIAVGRVIKNSTVVLVIYLSSEGNVTFNNHHRDQSQRLATHVTTQIKTTHL